MADFTISDRDPEEYEPDEPSGNIEWLFRHAGNDGSMTVPGNSQDEAWKAVRYHEGENWFEWMLVGRAKSNEPEDRIREVSAQFKHRNKSLVEKWEENDGK